MNLEKTFNNKTVRNSIRYVVLFPFAIISIVLGLYGLFFFIGGIIELNIIFLAIGIITITGWTGIIGAEKRLLKSTETLTKKEKSTIRAMLISGLLSSLTICVWAFAKTPVSLAIIPLSLSFGAFALILATP